MKNIARILAFAVAASFSVVAFADQPAAKPAPTDKAADKKDEKADKADKADKKDAKAADKGDKKDTKAADKKEAPKKDEPAAKPAGEPSK